MPAILRRVRDDEAEDPSGSGQALQLMDAGILENHARALEQAARRRRDQDVVRAGKREHPRGRVHRDAANIVADELHFPGVDAVKRTVARDRPPASLSDAPSARPLAPHSMVTHGTSPITHLSWPGGMSKTVSGPMSSVYPSSITTRTAPDIE